MKPLLNAYETLLAILAGCCIAYFWHPKPATALPAPARAVSTPAPTPRVVVRSGDVLSFVF